MPDFFIAGVPKAGTTALHVALTRHPALYMSAVKEPKFFLTDGPPSVRGGPGDAKTSSEHIWRRADYEALSDSAPAGVLRGESTPFYLYNRDAQRRIRAQTPDAKLIVVLRDPVERAHSNWTHLWSAGLEPIDDVVRACAEEDRRMVSRENVTAHPDRTLRHRVVATALRAGSAVSAALPEHPGPGLIDHLERILRRDAAPRKPLTWDQRQALIPGFETDIKLLGSVTGEDFSDWLGPRGDSGGLIWARPSGQRQARNGQPASF
jgi:hypothetical protein